MQRVRLGKAQVPPEIAASARMRCRHYIKDIRLNGFAQLEEVSRGEPIEDISSTKSLANFSCDRLRTIRGLVGRLDVVGR